MFIDAALGISLIRLPEFLSKSLFSVLRFGNYLLIINPLGKDLFAQSD